MSNPVSPKVVWPVVLGIVLWAIYNNINAVSPEMLNFLGPWKIFALGTFSTALSGIVGYYVKDALRKPEAPAEVPAAPEQAPVVNVSVPEPIDVLANLADSIKPPTP